MTPDEHRNVGAARRYVDSCNSGADDSARECWADNGVTLWFPTDSPVDGEANGAEMPPAADAPHVSQDRRVTIKSIAAVGELVVAEAFVGPAVALSRHGGPCSEALWSNHIFVWRFRDGLIASEHIYDG